MVKDDLAAFHDAIDAYNKASRWQAIKKFFKNAPDSAVYKFVFFAAVSITLSSILGGLSFVLDSEGDNADILLSIIGLVTGVAIFYFYLLKQHSVTNEVAQTYRRLLTYTFYQTERYIMFKDAVGSNPDITLGSAKELLQTRLQLDQGLKFFGVWLFGVAISLMVTVIYSLAPSGDEEKITYILIVSFFLLLSLILAYVMHDPFWFKNNKYRELLLFITIYESDTVSEDRT